MKQWNGRQITENTRRTRQKKKRCAGIILRACFRLYISLECGDVCPPMPFFVLFGGMASDEFKVQRTLLPDFFHDGHARSEREVHLLGVTLFFDVTLHFGLLPLEYRGIPLCYAFTPRPIHNPSRARRYSGKFSLCTPR